MDGTCNFVDTAIPVRIEANAHIKIWKRIKRCKTVEQMSALYSIHTAKNYIARCDLLHYASIYQVLLQWDDHLPKMCTFWGSLVLGAKQYRGNVQQAHQPLEGVEPQHFSRWLYLFLDTVESRYEPAAAVRFMEPALRIAQSLQLSRFGWDYKIPAEQQALLERVAPKRPRDDDPHEAHAPGASARRPAEPFPTRIIGKAKPD